MTLRKHAKLQREQETKTAFPYTQKHNLSDIKEYLRQGISALFK